MPLIKLRKYSERESTPFFISHNLIMSVTSGDQNTAYVKDITGHEVHVLESATEVARLVKEMNDKEKQNE